MELAVNASYLLLCHATDCRGSQPQLKDAAINNQTLAVSKVARNGTTWSSSVCLGAQVCMSTSSRPRSRCTRLSSISFSCSQGSTRHKWCGQVTWKLPHLSHAAPAAEDLAACGPSERARTQKSFFQTQPSMVMREHQVSPSPWPFPPCREGDFHMQGWATEPCRPATNSVWVTYCMLWWSPSNQWCRHDIGSPCDMQAVSLLTDIVQPVETTPCAIINPGSLCSPT